MDMRSRVNTALKQAMKDKAPARLSTLRLINAAIKDKDIATRGSGSEDAKGCGDAEVLEILGKMTKQRKESARAYEEGGRLDLAERELQEIAVIEEFLPKQLDDDEVAEAINTAITATGAGSIRDMGKVMGELKSRYTGQMDFGKVGPMVKDQLCATSGGGC
ncbi:MAG: GatB/YqeY domain-containing protein [Ruegeria sp.]